MTYKKTCIFVKYNKFAYLGNHNIKENHVSLKTKRNILKDFKKTKMTGGGTRVERDGHV